MTPGTLYLLPTPLSADAPLTVGVTDQVKEVVPTISLFLAEREKTARRFLRSIGYTEEFTPENLQVLNKDTPTDDLLPWMQRQQQGENLGILSEAGCPGIADPGSAYVSLAHECGFPVVPLVGPSSFVLALMASGLNGQSFQFHGYLPIDRKERLKALQQLERWSYQHHQTQIFMETPYRNQALFADILQTCRSTTFLSISANLTAPDAYIATHSIERWRGQKPDFHKKPAVFCLLSR